jgi:hypothetical protein
MFFSHLRSPGPASRGRWLMLVALAAAAVVVAGLQFTAAALLPQEKTATICGVALGLVAGSILFWIERRVAGEE